MGDGHSANSHDEADRLSASREENPQRADDKSDNPERYEDPSVAVQRWMQRVKAVGPRIWHFLSGKGSKGNARAVMAILTFMAFIVSIIYAGFAYLQWDATNQTLTEIRLENRPWVGLPNDIQVSGMPVFEVIGDSLFTKLQIQYDIRNVGTSPAFKTATQAFVVATNGTQPPDASMEVACLFATTNSDSGRGSALLPGGGIRISAELNDPSQVSFPEMRVLWIEVCLAYRDLANNLHHTKFRSRSNFLSEVQGPDMLGTDWFIESSDAN